MARILLVEDDEISRDMLTLRLELHGHEVITAADGEQALNLATTEAPDLILLDMNLPIMDGWTVASRLKKDAAPAGIPVIGVSAHAMSGDRDKALKAGCDNYVTKPVDWAALAPLIESYLSRGSL